MKKMVPSSMAAFNEDHIPEIVKRYKELFPGMPELSDKADQDILALQEFLELSAVKLSALVASTRQLTAHVDNVVNDLGRLNGFLKQLYTAERGYPACPKPARLDVMDSLEAWHAASAKAAPAYKNNLLKVFRYELQDVNAFLELLRRRGIVLARYNKASKQAEKWRMPDVSVDSDKLKAQRDSDLAKEKEEHGLLDLHTKLLLSSQVKAFWKSKTETFKGAFHNFSQSQLEVAESLVECWEQAVAQLE